MRQDVYDYPRCADSVSGVILGAFHRRHGEPRVGLTAVQDRRRLKVGLCCRWKVRRAETLQLGSKVVGVQDLADTDRDRIGGFEADVIYQILGKANVIHGIERVEGKADHSHSGECFGW